MAVFDGVIPAIVGAAGAGAAAGYEITRSLRFDSSSSSYLNRTPASAGNRRTFTWSGWCKRSKPSNSSNQYLFATSNSVGNDYSSLFFGTSDALQFQGNNGSASVQFDIATNAVYRDVSAWYHIVLSVDSTQSTSSDRIKLYVNGQQLDSFATATYPSQNFEFRTNSTEAHGISYSPNFTTYFDGYLADVHFIDGQALAPTDFGEYDNNNVWQPKEYAGTYGTNGFHLDFSDNSSNAALGTDSSGNSNTWTVNNLSVASGAGNDSLIDTPTNYEASSGNNGGNYATLNPLVKTSATTIANGNLDVTSSGQTNAVSSIVPSSGKWYLEITLGSIVTNSFIGLYGTTPLNTSYLIYGINGFGFTSTGWGSATSTVTGTGVAGDVIGLAFDADAKTLEYYKNGSSIGTISGWTYVENWSIGFSANTTISTAWVFNFGQRPFAYTPPTGYKSLCTTNLTDPTIADGSTAMNIALYDGNDSTNSITGLGFSPDMLWIKSRSSATFPALANSVVGPNYFLRTNDTFNESGPGYNDDIVSFDSDGFTLGADTYYAFCNKSPNNYVAWTWDAGSSTVSNTDGSITSSVRANPSAGFSIVSYTGTGGTGTVGHGLGVIPSMVIVKNRSNSLNWAVAHAGLSSNRCLNLNTTNDDSTVGFLGLSKSNFTSTTFTVNYSDTNTNVVNGSTNNYIAYCFAPVEGYSAFGSYTGNGSADGPFVYTGFRPAFLLIKRTDAAGGWIIIDTTRSTYNVVDTYLYADTGWQEDYYGAVTLLDVTSNGFKFRSSTTAEVNASNGTHIYAAFAEHPFKYSRAR